MYQEYRNAQLAEVQRLDARKLRYDQEKVHHDNATSANEFTQLVFQLAWILSQYQ